MQNNINNSYIKLTDGGVNLTVKVVPNSSKSEIVEKTEEFVKIKLKSQPIEGKANKELVNFLSDFLKVPKSKIEILRGEKNKLKIVKIKGEAEYFLNCFK